MSLFGSSKAQQPLVSAPAPLPLTPPAAPPTTAQTQSQAVVQAQQAAQKRRRIAGSGLLMTPNLSAGQGQIQPVAAPTRLLGS